MPVRVDGTASDTNGAKPDGGRRSSSPSGASGRRQLLIAALAVTVAVIVGIVVGSTIIRSTAGPGTALPPVEPSQAVSQGTSTGAPRVVEALPRSEVVAGEGGISNVYELRTGYGKSTNDAVQAATNFFMVDNGPAYYTQTHYEAIQAYMYASPTIRGQIGYRQVSVDAMRKQYKVNDQGQPLTNGQPDPTKKIWDAAYPQYGAYRIVEESADQVRVMIWSPVVYGVDHKNAADTTGIKIDWLYADKTVRWSDGDWRQTANNGFSASEVPKPSDTAQIVTSYPERASLLGTNKGWTLYANAADTDIPELQLPGK